MSDKELYLDNEESIDISLETMYVEYDTYFRRFGVRRLGQLSNPVLTETAKMALPKNAILLYLPEDDADLGIGQSHLMLQDATRLIYVNHHFDLLSKEGMPIRTMVQPSKLIREYLRRNRHTRVLKNIERISKDPFTVIVENFAMLNHFWRYRNLPLAAYLRWKNIESTLWTRSAELTKTADRNQYLIVSLPKILPSLTEFRKAAANKTRLTLESFNSNEALTLLDIWTWLGDNRSESLLSKVPTDQINKIHLIILESGVWSVISLGLLNDWRKTLKKEDLPEEDQHSGIDGETLQKYFLRYLNTLIEYRNNAAKTANAIVTKVIQDEVNDIKQTEPNTDKALEVAKGDPTPLPDPNDVLLGDIKNDKLNQVDKKLSLDKITSKSQDHQAQIKLGIDGKTIDRNKKIELISKNPTTDIVNDMDNELDSLHHLFNDEVDDVIHHHIDSLPALEKGIMRKADQLAEDGLISAGQYRRMSVLASKYKELPNPFGEGTMETLSTVSQEDIRLPEVEDLPDSPDILDKSMLKTVIEDMDKKYITSVLQKDVASAVLNIQKAGIAVTKYEVERIEDVMNDYHAYSIRLTPVNGTPSVIRFRLPNVQEDGSYISAGVRLQLRKQRIDVPIRKIDDRKVALTSYYSKVFVTRSEKVVNNYDRWLYNQIVLKVQETNSIIKNVTYSNTWNNNFVAPRAYSILAKHFSSLQIENKYFSFDYEKRFEIFGENTKGLEVDGRIVVGKQGTDIIVVTNDDDFIVVTNNGEIELGTFIDLLQLDETRSPIEVAEMTVSNKNIPLGVVLSYLIGFNSLLKLSGVKERRVVTGERFTLDKDEFAVKFIDETLIFSKRDKKAALLFGGFLTFKDVIRNYGVSTFNRKDIYYNVLDSKDIGLRYLREMDLMNDMWVDPITEGILKDMGEPIEFVKLLMRSLELLLTDWSPDETDMQYQRIRGYERFSGFVYQEIIKSIRQYNAQSTAINASIEMHPEAVWRTIDKDVSKYLIQESNPIHNLKEKETVTFSGSGGRSSETMVKRSRVFHENDLGVISEATPDNKSVGSTVFMTPNPQFNSLRGTVKKTNVKDLQNSSLLSTSALVSVASDQDD